MSGNKREIARGKEWCYIYISVPATHLQILLQLSGNTADTCRRGLKVSGFKSGRKCEVSKLAQESKL